jgi:hypothetical protein
MKKLLILMTLVFALLCLLNSRRVYINSPDGKKTITLFRPISFFWKSYYYIIPSKYSFLSPPVSGYAKVEPLGMCFININWQPKKAYRIKFAFSSGALVNKLPNDVYMPPNSKIDFYKDEGDSHVYPKYESYSLEELLSK